jgi:6-phosphogluconolactonase
MSPSHSSFLALAAAVTLVPTAFAAPADLPKSGKYWVYIGTYASKGGSEGIYRCELDVKTGGLSKPELAAKVASPSFLAVSPNNKFLYAVGETAAAKNKKEGTVYAYTIDANTGTLEKLNDKTTGGAGPCHVSINRTGKYAIIANYGGGSSVVYSLKEDGSLDERTDFRQHKGKSINKERQQEPHAHCAMFVEGDGDEFAYVVDLGLDKVFSYNLDHNTGKLKPTDPGFVKLPDGSGPRHIAVNKSSGKAYVCGELDSTLNTLRWDRNKGFLEKSRIAAASTLPNTTPEDVRKKNSTAEVVVHPSNGYVLVSNRGHNNIAVFKVSVESTELVAHITSAGGERAIRTPRNFNVDPTGKWVLIANQDGNTVQVAEWDNSGNGKLTGFKADISRPVCVKFVAKP